MENPVKMNDLGLPLFQEPTISSGHILPSGKHLHNELENHHAING